MALTKNTNTQSPAFEAPDDENEVDQGEAIRAAAQARLAAAAAQHAATKPVEESKSTAVAAQSPKAGQVAVSKPMVNPLALLKDAFRVEWDTLRGLKISNGNVIDNQTGKPLGDVIGLEILSYQDQWVISPGTEGDEGKEEVRYSDDGETTTKGEDCNEYLAALKKIYPKAAMTKRMVVAGSVFDIGDKGRKALPDLQDSLIQISLAPTSKATFDRYALDQAFKIAKGLLEPEGAQRVKIECTVTTKGSMNWTVGNFSRYDA